MTSGKVLLVDDEESVLMTMQAILMQDGHDVDAAQTGTHALELLHVRPFDVVLTDLRLNDIDGLQLLAEIKRSSPETVVILLTGYASLESAVRALRDGAYDYLFKPCDVEELKATVARGLERRYLVQQLRERMEELEEANRTIRALNQNLQRRVDAATATLRRRVADLSRAKDEIGELHRQAEQHIQELHELDRLKSQFLSMASHELKTPLTAISGYLQVALRKARRRLNAGYPGEQEWLEEQRTQVDHLEKVNGQTMRLARLVDELLDVSRIETGRIELRFEPLDLGEFGADVVTRMQHTTGQHLLRWLADLPPGQRAIVNADRDHLEQVLNNLIGNAIKYSPPGRTVTAGLRAAGSEVLVSVKDEGVGIPPTELDQIFSLFYRSPDAAMGQVSGLGLGLYISKEIVGRHGGRIWAESTPGHGSTFYVALPRPKTAERSRGERADASGELVTSR
ncbi:MAG: response regulator [Chloroflexi bacterium]|nr:response regulator [Chloroflexota bacterium]